MPACPNTPSPASPATAASAVTPNPASRQARGRIRRLDLLVPLAVALLLAACGGASEPVSSASADESDRAYAMEVRTFLPDRRRIEAAVATANSEANACSLVRPFYWEIGDKEGARTSGSVNSSSTRIRYTSRTPISYASASKWLYAAYVLQRRGGVLTDIDVKMLTLRSGYTSLKSCENSASVDACLALNGNGDFSAQADGKFFYNGGHMEKHASLIGLGAMGNAALATALRSQLGSDLDITFAQPQLAGGMLGTPEVYARFLRKLLGRQLIMGDMLGSSSVCTNPVTCGLDEALLTPIPPSESWRYSLGHWVESDPVVGDGAFSSGGALGFYPWIDAGRTTYGIVARVAPVGGQPSADCGRLIRKAWAKAVAQ